MQEKIPLTLEADDDSGTRRHRVARFLSRTIFASLVCLIFLTAIPYGAVEPWWVAVFECAVFVLAALWAVEGAVRGRWLVREHLLVLPILALSVFALMQCLPIQQGGRTISFDPYETRLHSLMLLALSLSGAMLLRYTTSERRLRALVYTVIATGLASAVFGIVRQTAQRAEKGFVLQYLMPGTGYAQFINRNHFAFLAEMSLGLILGLIIGRGVARSRWLVYAAFAVPIWVALILTNSRGGVFAMLCQVIFLAIMFDVARAPRGGLAAPAPDEGSAPEQRRSLSYAARLGLTALLLAMVVVGMVWVGGDPLAARMESVRDEITPERVDPTNVSRAQIWRATWNLFTEHPIAGVGIGGYFNAISSSHQGSGLSVPRQAHNDYLELLASGGIIGAVLLTAFLILFVRRVRDRLRVGSQFTRAAALGALAGLFGVAVHSFVDFGLHVTANALLFIALLAVAAASVRHGGEMGVQKTSRLA